MKVLYLTRVDISSNAAQARQIQSMGKAFNKVLADDFQLISGSPKCKDYTFIHKSVPLAKFPSLRYISACLVVAKHVLNNDYDVIFTRDIMVATVAILLGGRAIYEAHKDPRGKLPHYLITFLAKRKQFLLVCISRALGDYYRDRYAFPEERRLVAHDGVFPEDYSDLCKIPKNQLRRELELPENKILVVHTGSLYKGGAELFGAVVRGRQDTAFIQIGGSKSECNKWRQYYVQKGVDNIEFIPHMAADIVRKYQVAADLLFYISSESNPIYWCTSPLKLFEYMATGVPILGSRVGSVSEIINQSNALCFDPSRPFEIDKALLFFLNNYKCCAQLGIKAKLDVEKLYTWEKRVKDIVAFSSS